MPGWRNNKQRDCDKIWSGCRILHVRRVETPLFWRLHTVRWRAEIKTFYNCFRSFDYIATVSKRYLEKEGIPTETNGQTPGNIECSELNNRYEGAWLYKEPSIMNFLRKQPGENRHNYKNCVRTDRRKFDVFKEHKSMGIVEAFHWKYFTISHYLSLKQLNRNYVLDTLIIGIYVHF